MFVLSIFCCRIIVTLYSRVLTKSVLTFVAVLPLIRRTAPFKSHCHYEFLVRAFLWYFFAFVIACLTSISGHHFINMENLAVNLWCMCFCARPFCYMETCLIFHSATQDTCRAQYPWGQESSGWFPEAEAWEGVGWAAEAGSRSVPAGNCLSVSATTATWLWAVDTPRQSWDSAECRRPASLVRYRPERTVSRAVWWHASPEQQPEQWEHC